MEKFKRLWIKISSVYMLKNNERYAFGVPFYLHKKISKSSLRGLNVYKNIHKGERCFIIGTGPSLMIEDVRKLKNEYTIGVNTLYKMFDKLGWQTSYYCLVDPRTYGNIKDEFNKKDVKNLFYAKNRITDKKIRGIPFELECSDFYKLKAPNLFEFTKFSDKLDDYIYDGASVVYAAIQIAVYMGFKEVVLLGTDCNYGFEQQNHNDILLYKDYDYNWTKNTALTMIEGFKVARKYADQHGIKIYNATRGGMLEVFERINIDEYLKG